MPPKIFRRSLLCSAAFVVALVAGCATPRHPADWITVSEVSPAFLDSIDARDPAVAADAHGRVALTYVTRDTNGARELWLAVSRDSGTTFSAPVRVNDVPGSVSSYPEGRPAAVFGPAGALIVTWGARRPGVERAVNIASRASSDGGVTLGPVAYLNDDRASGVLAFHGFPAVAFRPDGALFAAWLDERDYATAQGEPTGSSLYRAMSFDGGQSWSANQRMRDTVCACCRPMVATDASGGIALAYRSAYFNLRDPALAVSRDGGSTFAVDTVLHADRWYLPGCPDVGPALTWNRDTGGHYAWYTGAGVPGVYLMSWRFDGGSGGMKRALTDSIDQATSPRMTALGEATLIGVEARPAADTTHTVFAVRALDPSGSLTPWVFLGGDVRDAWLAGADPHSAFACWVERDGDRSRTRVVRLVR